MVLQARLLCIYLGIMFVRSKSQSCSCEQAFFIGMAGWVGGACRVKPCSPTNSLSKGASSSRVQTQPSDSQSA